MSAVVANVDISWRCGVRTIEAPSRTGPQLTLSTWRRWRSGRRSDVGQFTSLSGVSEEEELLCVSIFHE